MIGELLLCAALTIVPVPDSEPPIGGSLSEPDGGGAVIEVLPDEGLTEGPAEEGDLVVLPDVPIDEGMEVIPDDRPIEEEIIDDPVEVGGSNTVIIITPDDVASVLQAADNIAFLSDFGTTGDSLLSGTFLTYCQGLAARVPWGQHYVAWRDSSDYYSESYFAYGDLSESNGQFEGDVQVLRYYRPNNNSEYRLEWSHDSAFVLDASNRFAYSDVGDFPALTGGEVYAEAALWLIGLCIGLRVLGWILFGRYER